MADPLTALTTAMKSLKTLYHAQQLAKHADLRIIISELNNSLADVQIELAAMKMENAELRERVAQLMEPPPVEKRGNVYYLRDPKPGNDSGPFCVGCHAKKSQLVPMVTLSLDFSGAGKWLCPVCGVSVP